MRTAVCCVMAALLAPAAPAAAQETLALDRGRMYPLPASQVWQAARDTLAALGMKTDEMDAEHQLVITKFRGYGGGTVAGPTVPGYKAHRFQLHVFVSPFAEPARVHVGSLSELTRMAGGTSTMYAGGAAETWFLDALDRRLGAPGRAIPVDAGARASLAAELGGKPCAAREGQVASPEIIRLSEVKLVYPPRAAADAHKGVVGLEFQVGEDGAIYGMRVASDSNPDQQFRHAALGMASVLRFTPGQRDGCPIPVNINWTINFGLARRGR